MAAPRLRASTATTVPVGRTEQEVAADVIALLLENKVMSRDPATIARASLAVRVPVRAIQRALEVREYVRAPLAAVPTCEGGDLPKPEPPKRIEPPVELPAEPSPAPDPVPDVALEPTTPKPRPSQAWNERLRQQKEPRPGIRICSQCGEQPKANFNVKSHRTGQLRSMCKECEREYKAERYLTLEKLEKLGPVLRFILESGDAVVGTPCETCSKKMKAGGELIATGAVFHHAHHF